MGIHIGEYFLNFSYTETCVYAKGNTQMDTHKHTARDRGDDYL